MDPRKIRKWHRYLAPIVFIPFFLTAATGVGYRVSKSWFGASDEVGDFFMLIHQGTWLGQELRVFYVLLNGLGLLAMLFTGITMTRLFRSEQRKINQ
ncbi:PepSY domain-containing protein [Spirulina sp. CS-785/01]|uniref:PepSY domain-containing protein n=1 Tax=Spirulina sp. CS-785/01 TaxID=3021716 RepID=UPI00232CD064|nr:PepSY domain-containing protein [Spirulina sp. CS-785/01]MDB9314855.1 PepSY domain-containing protein [Spirulina sp. CS-785/01]